MIHFMPISYHHQQHHHHHHHIHSYHFTFAFNHTQYYHEDYYILKLILSHVIPLLNFVS